MPAARTVEAVTPSISSITPKPRSRLQHVTPPASSVTPKCIIVDSISPLTPRIYVHTLPNAHAGVAATTPTFLQRLLSVEASPQAQAVFLTPAVVSDSYVDHAEGFGDFLAPAAEIRSDFHGDGPASQESMKRKRSFTDDGDEDLGEAPDAKVARMAGTKRRSPSASSSSAESDNPFVVSSPTEELSDEESFTELGFRTYMELAF